MNKRFLIVLLTIFVVLISTSSFVFASSIVDSNYQGEGFKSFMGGTHAQPGSSISHNSTFKISIDLNVSGDISAENFTDVSDITLKKLGLKDNSGHDIDLDNKSVTIDSGYIDGDKLHLELSGEYPQHITSSSELNNIFNFDSANVTSISFEYNSKTITANK